MVKVLRRIDIQRMVGGGRQGVAGGGSGSGGGGGGSVAYADEARHALEADHATNADNATSAGYATNAGHATTADSATHAASADEATHATSADTATHADHATTADSATHATSAANLDNDSTDWLKIARKDMAQAIAEVWTFAKGIVSTLRSYFNGGVTVTKAQGDTDKALIVTGGIQADTIDATSASMETLTVTKEAHFFKLVVDELAANKGAIIVSSANCVAEIVVAGSGYYDVYFSTTDKNGNTVVNPWMVNDQAICMTFSGAAGTFTNVSNRYYWRLVTQVASSETYQGATYHRIRLSNASGQYDGSTAPAAGDEIVQLGYRGSVSGTDYRKSAVILSAYPTPDTDLTPASLAFYQGIVTFNLSTYRKTYLDALNNEFIGNFKVLINGSAQNVATLLVTMEGLISNVQKKVGHNLLSTEAWTDGNGTLIEDFDSATTQYDAYQESSSAFTAFSPLIFLDGGNYCFSWYGAGPSAFIYSASASNKPTKPYDIGSSGVTGITTQAVSGESYKQKIRQYGTFSIPTGGRFVYLHLFKSSSFSFCRPMLQKVDELTDTPTAWDSGQQLFGSIIKQTADLIRLQVGECGLDLTNEAITAKGGKFKMQDNAGNDTFVLDQNGNLVSQGNASFGGTVKATNFYHGVVMHTEEDCWLCRQANGGYGFVVGKYYTKAEVYTISDGDYGQPPTSGTPDLFANCTGSADLVVIMAGTSGTGNDTIVLPCASDYDGKIVEIVDTRYVESGYMGRLSASQADGGWKMKGNFNQSAPSDTVTLNGNQDTEGKSYRLLSYKQMYNSTLTSFWILLKTS